MNFAKLTYIAVIALVGVGCSTVDLKDFSDKTADLQASIAAEHQEVISQYDEIIQLAKLGKKEDWFRQTVLPASNQVEQAAIENLAAAYTLDSWLSERKEFLGIATDVDKLLETLVAYSTALSNLAAQGETGKEAVEGATTSLTNIAKIVDPATAGIPGNIIAVLTEVGDIYTRAQAQEKLSDAMSLVASHQGAQKIAEVIKAYVDNGMVPLVSGLKGSRMQLERYKAGPDMIRFYNNQSTWQARQRTFALLNLDDAARSEAFSGSTEAQIYADLLKCYNADSSGCPNASAISGLASSQLLLRAVQSDVRQYKNTETGVLRWAKKRMSNGSAIKDAIDAWAVEHDRLSSYLAEFAGFRALKGDCGAYSAANLKMAIERVKNTLSEGEVGGGSS